MVTCRYINVPVVSPGKTKKLQNKTKQNNQNGFYDINIRACKHSLPVTVPMTSTWENRLCTSTLWEAWSAQPLLDGSADVLAGRLSSGSSRTTGCIVQSACPRKGFLRSQKAWCSGCPAAGVYCAGWHACLTHACTAHPLPCLHAHPWQGWPGRLLCSPPVCWQQLLCAYEEGGCLRLTAQAPAVSLAPSARGWALRPLCIADYNNHICTCFVLFCYFFTFLFFPGTQLGHYTCKSP